METNVLFFPGFESIFGYTLLFAQAVYALFSFIIVRQVKLMNSSFNTPLEKPFRFLALVHLLLSIAVLLISLVVLL
jgi:hypothetical protein